jgi:8-oxo-dGTP pyrophosphatase MutT (NUDIX family)
VRLFFKPDYDTPTNAERGTEGEVEETKMNALNDVENRFGIPRQLSMSFPMDASEFQNLKDSMKDGRNSDVTLFIFKDNKVIVIAKPWYPKGLYRAPSGGLKPDEDLELCAKREAYEETGAKIRLEKYILRIYVTFTSNKEKVNWISHVFTARHLSGDLKPVDTREIREVNLLSLDELAALKERLLESNSGGLHYRAALTEAAISEIRLRDPSLRSE